MTLAFKGRCLDCDYPLRRLPLPRCPECGRGFDRRDPATFRWPGDRKRTPNWPLAATSFVLLAVAAWMLRPQITGHSQAKIYATRALVVRGGPAALAIGLYQTAVGRRPRQLTELVTAPSNPIEATWWQGPYVNDPTTLTDPWGRPLRYRAPGKHNPRSYDLWSLGPDAQDGTDDDIGNWEWLAEPRSGL